MVVAAHLEGYQAEDALADGVDCLEHITSVRQRQGSSVAALTALISAIQESRSPGGSDPDSVA